MIYNDPLLAHMDLVLRGNTHYLQSIIHRFHRGIRRLLRQFLESDSATVSIEIGHGQGLLLVSRSNRGIVLDYHHPDAHRIDLFKARFKQVLDQWIAIDHSPDMSDMMSG